MSRPIRSSRLTVGSLVNTNLPANFTSSVSYDGNHAYLDLSLKPNFGSGLSGNQQAVANALTWRQIDAVSGSRIAEPHGE